MIWNHQGTRHVSHPYEILFGVRGYECWIRDGKKYEVLGRDIKGLDMAKALCDVHARTA